MMRVCKRSCVYQINGTCTLDCTDAVGQPALGGACLHASITDAMQLESPHRYCVPGSVPVPQGSAIPLHDMLE